MGDGQKAFKGWASLFSSAFASRRSPVHKGECERSINPSSALQYRWVNRIVASANEDLHERLQAAGAVRGADSDRAPVPSCHYPVMCEAPEKRLKFCSASVGV